MGHFGCAHFALIEVIEVGELIALGVMDLAAIVLESIVSFTVSNFFLHWSLR